MKQDPEVAYDQEFQAKVFKSFLRDGLIIAMPSQRKKRKVLLDYMAEDFEFDRPYTELEVNFKILDHYDDYCTVRREMVAEGLLRREHGTYFREKEEEESL